MTELLGVYNDSTVNRWDNMNSAHVEYQWLKEIFKELLTKATNFENTARMKEDRDNHWN